MGKSVLYAHDEAKSATATTPPAKKNKAVDYCLPEVFSATAQDNSREILLFDDLLCCVTSVLKDIPKEHLSSMAVQDAFSRVLFCCQVLVSSTKTHALPPLPFSASSSFPAGQCLSCSSFFRLARSARRTLQEIACVASRVQSVLACCTPLPALLLPLAVGLILVSCGHVQRETLKIQEIRV